MPAEPKNVTSAESSTSARPAYSSRAWVADHSSSATAVSTSPAMHTMSNIVDHLGLRGGYPVVPNLHSHHPLIGNVDEGRPLSTPCRRMI